MSCAAPSANGQCTAFNEPMRKDDAMRKIPKAMDAKHAPQNSVATPVENLEKAVTPKKS